MSRRKSLRTRPLALAAATVAVALLASGCAQLQPPSPKPLQASDIQAQLAQDRIAVQRDVQLGHRWTLDAGVHVINFTATDTVTGEVCTADVTLNK